ncbi:hypothetical protein QOT17_016548 [Balamuthia mandrillaris]
MRQPKCSLHLREASFFVIIIIIMAVFGIGTGQAEEQQQPPTGPVSSDHMEQILAQGQVYDLTEENMDYIISPTGTPPSFILFYANEIPGRERENPWNANNTELKQAMHMVASLGLTDTQLRGQMLFAQMNCSQRDNGPCIDFDLRDPETQLPTFFFVGLHDKLEFRQPTTNAMDIYSWLLGIQNLGVGVIAPWSRHTTEQGNWLLLYYDPTSRRMRPEHCMEGMYALSSALRRRTAKGLPVMDMRLGKVNCAGDELKKTLCKGFRVTKQPTLELVVRGHRICLEANRLPYEELAEYVTQVEREMDALGVGQEVLTKK